MEDNCEGEGLQVIPVPTTLETFLQTVWTWSTTSATLLDGLCGFGQWIKTCLGLFIWWFCGFARTIS